MIQSHIQYCILTRDAASKTTLNPLIKLQKRAVRLITNSRYNAHATPLFNSLNLSKIDDIHIVKVCKHMYQVNSKQYAGVNPSAYIALKFMHSYYTRKRVNENYFTKRTESKFGRTNIEILGPKYWTSVPSNLKNYSLRTFAKLCKEHIITLCEIKILFCKRQKFKISNLLQLPQ